MLEPELALLLVGVDFPLVEPLTLLVVVGLVYVLTGVLSASRAVPVVVPFKVLVGCVGLSTEAV